MLTRLRLVLLLRLGFPELWLRWPFGIARGLAAAVSVQPFLSSFEWWTRSYYERIARDFRHAGRLGYVWDEALGVPFGPRIYNNAMTYLLYGALDPRAFRLLAVVAYLGTIVAVGVMSGHGLLAAASILLLLGSPLGLHSLVGYMIKPEVPWWSLALVAAAGVLGGDWALALGVGGILLLVNASVAAITALLLAPLWLHTAWTCGALPGGVALFWLVPGLLKTLLRVFQARADGMGREVAVEQKKVARHRPVTFRELLSLTLWFGVPLSLAGASMGLPAFIVGAAAILFWLVNGHLVKLADTVTVQLALLTLLVALTLVSGSWLGIAGIAWFAFYQPFAAFPAMAAKSEADAFRQELAGDARGRLRTLRAAARDYPWFALRQAPSDAAVVRLLEAIPAGARVLLESNGDGRVAGSYLHFRNWADSVVAPSRVELVNQFFLVRLVEPALADLYLDRFTAKSLNATTMARVCSALGVSFVLAFTVETAAALEVAGFRRVLGVGAGEMADLADVLHMPSTGIILLAAPGLQSLIEPAVAPTREGNTLRWEARAGEEYLVRYRYHRNFRARQGETPVEVSPTPVLSDLPLRFMRLRAVADGSLELEFRTRWLG